MLLDLPPEILLRVFQLACLDSGRTGRALSAVSRDIRAISGEYRYQSLAVEVTRSRTTRANGSEPGAPVRAPGRAGGRSERVAHVARRAIRRPHRTVRRSPTWPQVASGDDAPSHRAPLCRGRPPGRFPQRVDL